MGLSFCYAKVHAAILDDGGKQHVLVRIQSSRVHKRQLDTDQQCPYQG